MGRKRSGQKVALTIQYPAKGRNQRKVVCIFYGLPPITAAEVEIMHRHLQHGSADPGLAAAAQNDAA